MFDFLFKRRRADGNPSSSSDTPQAASASAQPSAARAQIRQREREQALLQAAALSDEQSALAFILQCEFADARLAAAPWLQSQDALSAALRAVRNSDRRVAKLLQTRLDDIVRQQHARQQMRTVIEQAEILLRDPGLTPDRAADADRAWKVAGGDRGDAPDPALVTQFAAVRDALSKRLAEQAQLQRSLIDTRALLQKIQDALQRQTTLADAAARPAADEEGDGDRTPSAPAAIAATLDRLQQQIGQDGAAPEAAAMPKQLLPDCERLLQSCRAAHQRLSAAAEIRQSEASPEIAAAAAAISDIPTEAGAEEPASNPAKAAKSARKTATAAADPERLPQWLDLLEQLESALEQGALQAASEAERALRDYDARALKPGAAAMSRLAAAQASLRHLQGWARWGGNISREELLQAALALPEQTLPVPELVQKIGGLRARWKLLSASAGQAPQALWERFDAACSAAYAPAAAQFERQDREREEHRAAAEALIAETVQFVAQHAPPLATSDAGAADVSAETAAGADARPDWKKLAQFDARMRQAWQRIGPLGHKEKRVLERAFNAALKPIQAPLQSRRKIEIDAREAMIAQISALQPEDRQALDTVRAVQADWQQRAQTVPLSHKDEQALWQAFRAACDTVFAQRKETAANQDAQRQTHLQQKQALCEQLEQARQAEGRNAGNQAFDAAAARDLLQQAQTQWARLGPAPRAAERAIEQRFKDAAGALKAALQAIEDSAAAAAVEVEAALIDERLTLCFALDASLAEGRAAASDAPAWRNRWLAGTRLPEPFEQVLTRRFEQAVAAIGDERGAYLSDVRQRRETFDEALLEAEIAAGLDSPPEQARQRMQLQVALLQSSLKAGSRTVSGRQQLLRLCALPALADGPTLERIGKIVRHALQR